MVERQRARGFVSCVATAASSSCLVPYYEVTTRHRCWLLGRWWKQVFRIDHMPYTTLASYKACMREASRPQAGHRHPFDTCGSGGDE